MCVCVLSRYGLVIKKKKSNNIVVHRYARLVWVGRGVVVVVVVM